MTKRVLSLLLVLVMVLSLSVPALAAEGEETAVAAVEQTETTPAAEAVDEPAVVDYTVLRPENAASLEDAIQNNQNPIQLGYWMDDSSSKVTIDRNVTIDLGGNKIGGNIEFDVTAGTLTITDNTQPYEPSFGRGKLDYVNVGEKGTLVVQGGTVKVVNAGTVNVAGGCVDNAVGGDVNVTAGELKDWTASEGATLNVSGGKVSSGITLNADADVVISGGEVVGVIYQTNGTLTMTGGKITGYIDAVKGKVTITDGTVKNADGGAALAFHAVDRNDLTLSVSGGTFIGKDRAVWVQAHTPTDTHYISGGKFIPCIGGEFAVLDGKSNIPTEVAEGATVAQFKATSDIDYTYYTMVGKTLVETTAAGLKSAEIDLLQGPASFTNIPDDMSITNYTKDNITVNGTDVVKPGETWGKWEAKIGDVRYYHFYDTTDKLNKSAFSEAKSGQTITLLKDVVINEGMVLTDKNLTIDLNNHILSLNKAFDVYNTTPTVRTRTLRFVNGDVKGQGASATGYMYVGGSNVTIDLVDTYFHCPLTCNPSSTGNKLNVQSGSFLAGITGVDDTHRWNGSVNVAGKVLGDMWVDAKGEFEVYISGEVEKSVYVDGDEGTFTMVPGAKIGGDLFLGQYRGEKDHAMDVKISGGEVCGSTLLFVERHSDAVISDGVFGSDKPESRFVSKDNPDGLSARIYKSVTGGIFAPEVGNPSDYNDPHPYVVGRTPIATVTDGATTPYKYSGYWHVGNNISAALNSVSATGSMVLRHGDLTLTAVPNSKTFMIEVADDNTADSDPSGAIPAELCTKDPVLKVGYVTIGRTYQEIPGSSINELNQLISKASNLYASGKISEPDQAALFDAVSDGRAVKSGYNEDDYEHDETTFDPEALVQDAIDQLNAILVKYPNADTPDAPWYPAGATGWQKNPTTGDIYFFIKGEMAKNLWVYSARKIWYYFNTDGIMETGVAYAYAARTYKVYDAAGTVGEYNGTKLEPAGWYYFETSADSDAPGRIRGGWHYTADYGWVWSIKEHNGKYGMITWADKYKGPIPTI